MLIPGGIIGLPKEVDPCIKLQGLRDQFAMAALTGMLAHSTRYKPREEGVDWHWSIAKEAYEIADHMMLRREEEAKARREDG